MRGIAWSALVLCAGLIAASACAPPPTQREISGSGDPIGWQWIDLGHTLSPTDPTWSGTTAYSRVATATADKDGYSAGKIDVLEHFGTHVDAPSHFAPNGLTVDRLTTDQLVRPGFRINVTARVAGNEDYAVTVEDIAAFEAEHGRIKAQSMVLIATGWDSRWPDPVKYMNVRGGVKHFPGLSIAAARFLADDRMAAGIGIDTPSVDVGTSTTFEVHGWTMSKGVYHIENGARFTALPPKDFTVVVAPIKIAGGSGAPARVFAVMPAPPPNR